MVEWSKPFDNVAMVVSAQRSGSAAFVLIQDPSDECNLGTSTFRPHVARLPLDAMTWK